MLCSTGNYNEYFFSFVYSCSSNDLQIKLIQCMHSRVIIRVTDVNRCRFSLMLSRELVYLWCIRMCTVWTKGCTANAQVWATTDPTFKCHHFLMHYIVANKRHVAHMVLSSICIAWVHIDYKFRFFTIRAKGSTTCSEHMCWLINISLQIQNGHPK